MDLNHSRNAAAYLPPSCDFLAKRVFLPALIVSLNLLLIGLAPAQAFTTLHTFTGSSNGANPYAGLILSGNTLYGTSFSGGVAGKGTVFAVNTDGTGFTNLHSFTALQSNTNSDGGNPYAGLILSGNTLYGTSYYGGSSGNGTLFALNTNGTGFTTLHEFTGGSDGANPFSGLILSGNILYGTAYNGGSSGNGTLFALNTNGTGFTTLHEFTGGSDGANPFTRLILSGSTLYGMTDEGGSSGNGMVFVVSTNGAGFTTLHSFAAGSGLFPNITNSDGATPSELILLGNTLYGTTEYGGSSGAGTLFAANTNGTGFTTLHSFTGGSDGANPNAGLILFGNTLYGTASYGGSSGNGTVFAINTNGTGFTTLHSFAALQSNTNTDGANPDGSLILSGNTFYGTALNGGSSGNGTLFSISFTPRLAISHVGTNVILTWPTNVAGFDYTGFTLQSTTNLVSPAGWNTVSPVSVVVSGQNTVTNPISGTQKFYRLSQ